MFAIPCNFPFFFNTLYEMTPKYITHTINIFLKLVSENLCLKLTLIIILLRMLKKNSLNIFDIYVFNLSYYMQ